MARLRVGDRRIQAGGMKAKILVVDDEKNVRASLEGILGDEGLLKIRNSKGKLATEV